MTKGSAALRLRCSVFPHMDGNRPFRTDMLKIMEKAFQVADNVVFVLPRRSGDGYHALLNLAKRYGFGIRTTILLPKVGRKTAYGKAASSWRAFTGSRAGRARWIRNGKRAARSLTCPVAGETRRP
jgi:hypothetical protein